MLLFALCGIVLLLAALMAVLYGLQGISALLKGQPAFATTFLITAAGTVARMLLLLPACYYALMRILERDARHLRLAAVPSLVLVVFWLGSLGLGAVLARLDQIAPLLMPVLSVLGAILPIWLILRLAMRGLNGGSDLRRWGTFALGSTAGPFLSSVLEVLTILTLIIGGVVYMLANPAISASLQNLAARLQETTTDQALLKLLLPYLTRPSVIALVILTICVLTPIIEEALKPIGVWLGAGKIASPAQGFVLGALCGAGFAIFENFSAAAVGGPDWAVVTIMRVGTAVMHIANSALMGWALVGAWRNRRYLRLGLVYALVIFTHGLWNLLAISYGVSTLPPLLQDLGLELNFSAPYALPGLALLAIIMFCVLLIMNRRLQPPPYSGLATDSLDAPGGDLRV